MKAEEDRGGSSTWDSFAGGPDAATARVREPYPAGLRSRAALVHGVGAPIRRRVVPAGSGPPGRVMLVHDTSADRIDAAQVRSEQHDGETRGRRTTCTTRRVSRRCTRDGLHAPGVDALGIVMHALSSRRPHHLALLACRVAPSRHLRSGTVVTGAGEGRIITLIHVKHVGRRFGRHADATSVGPNAGFCCHSDETPGGSWTGRRRRRSTRYNRVDLSLSHNMIQVYGEWILRINSQKPPDPYCSLRTGQLEGADTMTVTQQPRRWRTAIAAALTLVASVVTVGMSPAAASAREPYPVPYFLFVQDEFTNPGGSAAGSNDWSCKPTAEHPNPVVLVHGTAGNRLNNWTTFAPLLANEGYCVFAPTFGNYADQPYPISAIGGMLRAEDSAAQIGAFVDEVLAATGAERVDILGVSQGSVVPNYFVKYLGGAAKVDKYISLGPAWNGSALTGPDGGATLLALGTDDARGVLPFCQACVQFLPASQFIAKLHEGGLYAPEVTYTNIMTRYDEGIWPYTSGYVEGPNATNIVVQDGCSQDYSDHIALLASRVTAGHVLNALDPDHPRPVPCVFVAPFVGG